MQKKTYTVKEIEAELYTHFPEMRGFATFIDPKDYGDIKDMEDVADIKAILLPLFQADAQQSQKQADAYLTQRIAHERMSMSINLIEAGMPFAQNLCIDENADSMAGKSCIIFGGKSDLSAKDILWAVMVPASSNMIAGMDENFQQNLKKEIEQHYQIPKELNDAGMLQTLFLDHEIGHALTMSMMKKTQMFSQDLQHHMECIADGYSLIRHYQRYGHDSKMGEYLSAMRNAAAIMVPDTIHWTSEALDAVMEMNKQGKLDNLSPQEAVDLAVQIANETSFGLDEGNNIRKAFDASPLKNAFKATASKALGNILSESFNGGNEGNGDKTKPANDDLDIMQDFKEHFTNNTLQRIKNKDQTIERIGNIALTTKSSSVYRVAKNFLGNIDKLWPNVNQGQLQDIRQKVQNRPRIPITEAKAPLLLRGMRRMMENQARKKFGK